MKKTHRLHLNFWLLFLQQSNRGLSALTRACGVFISACCGFISLCCGFISPCCADGVVDLGPTVSALATLEGEPLAEVRVLLHRCGDVGRVKKIPKPVLKRLESLCNGRLAGPIAGQGDDLSLLLSFQELLKKPKTDPFRVSETLRAHPEMPELRYAYMKWLGQRRQEGKASLAMQRAYDTLAREFAAYEIE